MRILFTNNTLGERAGTEIFVRDLAVYLKDLGHEVAAYSPHLGVIAEELLSLGVFTVSDLAELPFKPDIIHAQHHLETMTALLFFPHTPAVYFCHGTVPWQETPPLFPRIIKYIAVDECCHERLHECGVSKSKTVLLPNFVDTKRFKLRAPLPPKPKRALIFSNYASENNYIPYIREACRMCDIELDVMGRDSGHICDHPELILPNYDLVFAKSRAAMEALAVGCAVIPCDSYGYGTMVALENLEKNILLNFGYRLILRSFNVDNIKSEIISYDPVGARIVAEAFRELADIKKYADSLLNYYKETIETNAKLPRNWEDEEKATAKYMAFLSSIVKNSKEESYFANLQELVDSYRSQCGHLSEELIACQRQRNR